MTDADAFVVIGRIAGEHTAQMPLAENNELIQAFAAKRADQTFSSAVLPWRSKSDRPVADAHGPDPGGEDLPVGTVIVAHQVVGRRCPWKRLGDLPGQPIGCRMCVS
jgi:hypothetical protein